MVSHFELESLKRLEQVERFLVCSAETEDGVCGICPFSEEALDESSRATRRSYASGRQASEPGLGGATLLRTGRLSVKVADQPILLRQLKPHERSSPLRYLIVDHYHLKFRVLVRSVNEQVVCGHQAFGIETLLSQVLA